MESLSSRTLIGAVFFAIIARGVVSGAMIDKDLDGIKKKIESEKKGLSQLQIKEGGVLKSLGKIQDDLEKKSKDLKIADARHTSTLDAIQKTEIELDNLRGSIIERENVLHQRAVALYRWQRGGNPFWLGGGPGDVIAMQQRKRYLEATMAFDQGLLADLRNQSQRQQVLRLQLNEQKDLLIRQRKVLQLARAAFAQEADKKKSLLMNLRQERNTRLKALREMEAAALRRHTRRRKLPYSLRYPELASK